jgi:hypothetical protein
VSTLLVPAASALAGRAAWWPGRPAGAGPAGAGTAVQPAEPRQPALDRAQSSGA